jgi:hypothetical protein
MCRRYFWQDPSRWILPIIWDLLISSGVMSIFRCCLQISTILSSVLFSSSSKIQIARKERRIDSFWTNDGRIFLKKTSNSPKVMIKCVEDIYSTINNINFVSVRFQLFLLFKNLILYLPVTEATNKLARTFMVDFTDYMRPVDIKDRHNPRWYQQVSYNR